MVLLIDNYDSFTYNLYQYIEAFGLRCEVRRNDEIDLDGIEALKISSIVISPGPGAPDTAGVSLAAIERFAGRVPILGVCLGHQAIGQVYGAKVIRAPRLHHGKISPVQHCGTGLYAGVANPFAATRYHSLILERSTLPDCLEVTCETDDGIIMGVRHRQHAVEGVQFHPESIATSGGENLLRNFFRIYANPLLNSGES